LELLLIIIVVLLFFIEWHVAKISKPMREHSPTEKEQDYDWSQKDPMGHWNKNDKTKRRQTNQ
jgi:hypothetical protein